MKDKIKLALKNYYHDMAISDLRLQNQDNSGEKLTYNDILYLNIIQAHSGEYTASKIADLLFVSRPAVTQKINELEKKGLVYKKQGLTDKRVYKLFIGKDGFANTYNNIIEDSDDLTANLLYEKYTEKEIALFCEMLEEMRVVFSEAYDSKYRAKQK